MKNPGRSQLNDVQHDPAEMERCKKDPVYFYNRYVRKEGEKVLDKKEYEAHVKAVEKFRQNIS